MAKKGPIRIGRYEVLRKIATGGMAELFLAKQTGMEGFEKVVAIKRILSHLAHDEEFINMFRDEARIVAKLQHPNIVQIYDLGKTEDSYFIAMEYIPGRNLSSIAKRAKKKGQQLPPVYVARCIAQACEGLHYAHNRTEMDGTPLHIVHRDVSPQNIICGFSGQVKLVDFGIAKAATKVAHTRAGVLKGKYAYMSPEQIRGEIIDARSDVFAVGIVLYELLCGRRPFEKENSIQTLKAIVQEEPVDPRQLNGQLPSDLADIIDHALTKKREDRYQTAQDVQIALEDYVATSGQRSNNLAISQWLNGLFAEELNKKKGATAVFKGVGEVILPEQEAASKKKSRAAEPQAPSRSMDSIPAPSISMSGGAPRDDSSTASEEPVVLSRGRGGGSVEIRNPIEAPSRRLPTEYPPGRGAMIEEGVIGGNRPPPADDAYSDDATAIAPPSFSPPRADSHFKTAGVPMPSLDDPPPRPSYEEGVRSGDPVVDDPNAYDDGATEFAPPPTHEEQQEAVRALSSSAAGVAADPALATPAQEWDAATSLDVPNNGAEPTRETPVVAPSSRIRTDSLLADALDDPPSSRPSYEEAAMDRPARDIDVEADSRTIATGHEPAPRSSIDLEIEIEDRDDSGTHNAPPPLPPGQSGVRPHVTPTATGIDDYDPATIRPDNDVLNAHRSPSTLPPLRGTEEETRTGAGPTAPPPEPPSRARPMTGPAKIGSAIALPPLSEPPRHHSEPRPRAPSPPLPEPRAATERGGDVLPPGTSSSQAAAMRASQQPQELFAPKVPRPMTAASNPIAAIGSSQVPPANISLSEMLAGGGGSMPSPQRPPPRAPRGASVTRNPAMGGGGRQESMGAPRPSSSMDYSLGPDPYSAPPSGGASLIGQIGTPVGASDNFGADPYGTAPEPYNAPPPMMPQGSAFPPPPAPAPPPVSGLPPPPAPAPNKNRRLMYALIGLCFVAAVALVAVFLHKTRAPSLIIETTPPGARVFIAPDGAPASQMRLLPGETPLTHTGVQPGKTYRLRIVSEGYKTTVQLVPIPPKSTSSKVDIRLVPDA